MTMTYKPTGTKIYFEGADGDKIKGWKTPDMPTTDIFFEEITDFKTDEELTSIKLSILRQILPEGYKYTFFNAYNPPKRKSHWVNKLCESQVLPSNIYVHHSDYRTNPFLPKEFFEEAEHCKQVNERRWRWEYLGEPIGSGIVPFDNLTFREITDEEFKSFDNLRAGNDWGYAVDPNAYVCWHYDKTRRKIYAMHDIYKVKMSNEELATEIKKLGLQRERTAADSAEPKSIAQLKQLGCNFVGAKKGKGSVETGEKWLDELEEIVIDPRRTPDIAKEFESADYETDKDGNIIPRLQDKDNHTIDATRYAFEGDIVSNTWGWN
jgi:phage terminase large subunit